MGYGMADLLGHADGIVDLLGHAADGIVKDINNGAVEEPHNKQTNLNIPEQAIIRAL